MTSPGVGTTDRPTLLKLLLRTRHLQEHRAFCRAWDRVAKQVDPALAGRYPSKATFYRWLGGGLTKLPHPGACQVLEQMFPGCSADVLFERWDEREPLPDFQKDAQASRLAGHAAEAPRRTQYADLTAAYATRAEYTEQVPPHVLLDNAKKVQTVGLSLNMLCQQYGDQRLRGLLERGARLECLFLDPDGDAMRARELEENHQPGDLAGLTRLNMQMLRRLRAELPDDDREQVGLRTYDETVRFNLTIVDTVQCVAQPYLPSIRGVDSPTFVVSRRGTGGMFATFERVFTTLWDGGKTCA